MWTGRSRSIGPQRIPSSSVLVALLLHCACDIYAVDLAVAVVAARRQRITSHMIHCRAASICPAGKCLISAFTKCDVKCSATSPRWESVTTAILLMRL